jgi:hypothetical protein
MLGKNIMRKGKDPVKILNEYGEEIFVRGKKGKISYDKYGESRTWEECRFRLLTSEEINQ